MPMLKFNLFNSFICSIIHFHCQVPSYLSLTCIRRLEAVIAAVASDFDLWWVFFGGVVNVEPVAPGEAGKGKVWEPADPDGLKGDLSQVK